MTLYNTTKLSVLYACAITRVNESPVNLILRPGALLKRCSRRLTKVTVRVRFPLLVRAWSQVLSAVSLDISRPTYAILCTRLILIASRTVFVMRLGLSAGAKYRQHADYCRVRQKMLPLWCAVSQRSMPPSRTCPQKSRRAYRPHNRQKPFCPRRRISVFYCQDDLTALVL